MRAADLTLREDPRDPRTIDSLLASGWFSNWQRPVYELAANLRVCVRDDPRPAVRLGAQAPRMASASRYEVRYGKTECKLRGLAVGLITAGFTPRCIAVGEAPDSLVTFDGGDVWVEFAEIVDAPSARYTNMMNDLSRDVRDDVDADAQASRAAKGYHLEFRLAACPTKAEMRAVREDLVAFLRSGSHAVLPARTLVPVSTRMLQRMGTTLYCVEWAHYENGSPHILHVQSRRAFVLSASARAGSVSPSRTQVSHSTTVWGSAHLASARRNGPSWRLGRKRRTGVEELSGDRAIFASYSMRRTPRCRLARWRGHRPRR